VPVPPSSAGSDGHASTLAASAAAVPPPRMTPEGSGGQKGNRRRPCFIGKGTGEVSETDTDEPAEAEAVPPPPARPPPESDGHASTLAVPVALAALQIPHYSAARHRVGNRQPHHWLSTWRLRMAQQNLVAVDLTDDHNVHWRQWICQMTGAREVIGPGVTKFEGCFLRSLEPNRAQLAQQGVPEPLVQYRFDFVANRVDGTAARLHPSRNTDALITYGSLDDWGGPDLESRAPTPGARSQPMPPRTRGEPFQGFSQTDVVSNEFACKWMADRARTHGEADLHEEMLTDDLLPGDFPWHRFLMGRPRGQAIMLEGLTTMTLVRLKGQPAFRFTTMDHPEVRHIRVSGKQSWIVKE